MGVLEEPTPNLRVLGPGDEGILEAFLKERLESSMFLLGNAHTAGLTDRGRELQGTYVAAFEHGRVVALAAHYWNGNLVVQAPVLAEMVAREAHRASGRAVEGVLGPAEQVERVVDGLNIVDAARRFGETEKLYDLSLVDLSVPDMSETVRTRLAEPKDLDVLTRYRVAYTLETLNETETTRLWEACRASVRRYAQQKRLWVSEIAGQLVSCSAFNATTHDAVQVGGVYTPPARRGRGYARGVVAASLLSARAEGITRAVLFTPLHNAAAQRAYEAIGFRLVGDYRVVTLKAALR